MTDVCDVYGFTFADWEKPLLEHAFELFLKQERRAKNHVMAARIADMLDVIKNAEPNTESLFSLEFAHS